MHVSRCLGDGVDCRGLMLLGSDPGPFPIPPLCVLIVGWAFAAGMYFFGVPYEIRRAKRMVAELKEYLSQPNHIPDAG